MSNPLAAPLVIGDPSAPTRRVMVMGVGATAIDPLLAPGKALYVSGDGVQALLDAGVLVLA